MVKYSELITKSDILSQGQKSWRINWATNENDETTLTPGAKIYSKLIGLKNIELSDKSNNTKKIFINVRSF